MILMACFVEIEKNHPIIHMECLNTKIAKNNLENSESEPDAHFPASEHPASLQKSEQCEAGPPHRRSLGH